jgi:pseudouridine synthase
MGVKVDPTTDVIKVDGMTIRPPKKSSYLYFVLNKPSGYITSLHDPEGRQTVMELLPPMARRLRPVGRLDYNTEGILLFTDDGELLHRLTHPSYGVRRRYLVRAKGIIEQEKLEKLKTSGIFLEGAKIKNIDISDIRCTNNCTWFEIEIGEGRNREIRKIVMALGGEVSRLKRIAYGAVYKGIPPKGLFRPLTKQEVQELYTMVGME